MKQMKIGKKNLCKPIESKDQTNTCRRKAVFKKIIQAVKETTLVTHFHYYKLFTQQYFFKES